MQPQFFRDRSDAGRLLATRLAAYTHRPDVLVLALPRGGVPVAYEVAHALNAPLDVFLVRKLGVPGYEVDEVIGAITPDPFYAVGLWYEDFSQTTDEEVRELLARSTAADHTAPSV